MYYAKNRGFTLSEMLVTITIVAVVAVLLIGLVSKNISERITSTKKVLFNNQVAVALADMHANGELEGYNTQEEFNKVFFKYLDMQAIDDTEIDKYFAKSYTYTVELPNGKTEDRLINACGYPANDSCYKKKISLTGEILMSALFGGMAMAEEEVVSDGFTFSDTATFDSPYDNSANQDTEIYQNRAVTKNGVSFAYTYKVGCKLSSNFAQDSSTFNSDTKNNGQYDYLAKNEALSCIEGFYDVNGAGGENKYGKDAMLITRYAKDCYDKDGNITGFIPDPYGNCPQDNKAKSLFAQNYCSLTEMNCQDNGALKTLDKSTCTCVCKTSCPRGYILNKNTCKCECDVEALAQKIGCIKSGNTYVAKEGSSADCEASISACVPIAKRTELSCNATTCRENNGEWDNNRLYCNCEKANKIIENNSYGFATADSNNCCAPKCKFSSDDKEFKSLVEKNAKAELKDDEVLINFALESTKSSQDLDNGCYICAKGEKSNGFCTRQKVCGNLTNTKFFSVNNEAQEPKDCYVCNAKALQDYANTLNAKNAIKVVVHNRYLANSNNNLKKAQAEYFLATEAGKNRPTVWGYNPCSNCPIIYSFSKDTSKKQYARFFGFLYYINEILGIEPATVNESAYLTNETKENMKDFSKDSYTVRYKADTDNCAIVLQEFDYGQPPQYSILWHGENSMGVHTGYGSTWGKQSNFSFEDVRVGKTYNNPNKEIEVPEQFRQKVSNQNIWSDFNWQTYKIGVLIGYSENWDPLAMNISNSPNNSPTSAGSTNFKLKYDSEKQQYTNIKIKWPNKNSYQFIVINQNNSFLNNKHIGYMLSDERSYNGKKYSSGFAQLKAQFDSNSDGLITDDELNNLYLYGWDGVKNSQTVNKLTSVKNIAFDINTHSVSLTNAQGSALQNNAMIYDIAGTYRRLISSNKNAIDPDSLIFLEGETKDNVRTEKWIKKANLDKYLSDLDKYHKYLDNLAKYNKYVQDKKIYDKYVADKKIYDQYVEDKKNYDTYSEKLERYNSCVAGLDEDDKNDEEKIKESCGIEPKKVSQPTKVNKPALVENPARVDEPAKVDEPVAVIYTWYPIGKTNNSDYKFNTFYNGDSQVTVNKDKLFVIKGGSSDNKDEFVNLNERINNGSIYNIKIFNIVDIVFKSES